MGLAGTGNNRYETQGLSLRCPEDPAEWVQEVIWFLWLSVWYMVGHQHNFTAVTVKGRLYPSYILISKSHQCLIVRDQ